MTTAGGERALHALEVEITACAACPRLVAWRTRVARERRPAFAEEPYWGRPIPGFGDPDAQILLLGLAPAAHGGNRTGRVFTGDRSGDFLFAALFRNGLCNRPESTRPGDGLRVVGAYLCATVRCAPPANKPTPKERDRCLPFLARELALLRRVRVVVALGAFAWDAALRVLSPEVRPKPRFAHGAVARPGRFVMIGSYHPSQQNTFTGRLTPKMLDSVLRRAIREANEPVPGMSAAHARPRRARPSRRSRRGRSAREGRRG